MGFSQASCIIAQCPHCMHHSKISFLTKESHQPSGGKCLVKYQSSFLLIIFLAITIISVYYALSSVHSTGLYFALGCMPLSRALSALEVTLATLEVLVMASVPTAWAI